VLTLEPTSVLIVDDAVSTRRFVRAVLEHSPQFDIAGEAHNGEVAIEQAESLQPDLVLLDLSMPQLDGAGALSGIVGAAPGAKVVIFSGLSPTDGLPLLAAGAAAFVPKGIAPFDLLSRLESIARRPATFDGHTSWDEIDRSHDWREPDIRPPTLPHHQAVMYGPDAMIRKMVTGTLRVCEVDVVAETYTAPILLAVVDLVHPDIVVLDLSARDAPRSAVLSEIRLRSPRSALVVYADTVEWEQLAIDAGASVFVTQPRVEHLAEQIRRLVISP
jgi:DNA-binding NarL/FixJ family response regulator